MAQFTENYQAMEKQNEFWRDMPGGAAVVVSLVLPQDHGMFTYPQKRTIGALEILMGDRFDVDVSIPARGLLAMPRGVFTITKVSIIDEGDGPERHRIDNKAVYLHPDGSIRSFYYPAQQNTVVP